MRKKVGLNMCLNESSNIVISNQYSIFRLQLCLSGQSKGISTRRFNYMQNIAAYRYDVLSSSEEMSGNSVDEVQMPPK